MNLSLPWPPTANTYWRRKGSQYFISRKGIDYRKEVIIRVAREPFKFNKTDRLRMTIEAFPPDRRRRDLDNICKALLDSLQWANVYDDDSQIDELIIRRMPVIGGKVIVEIETI